jgi:hypothetical protein
MARLCGHAIAMTGRFTEHTYVTSSERHVWPCAGRSEGGPEALGWASCLAGAHSTAGIIFTVTGWCHQMANRILHPAGVDVSEARGCRFTHRWWGKYGLDASGDTWPELRHCVELGAGTGLQEGGTPFLAEPTTPDGPPASAPSRLDEMIDEHLGVDYAPAKRAHLRQLDAEAEREQRELVCAFQANRLTPEQYLEQFTRLAGDLFASYERILGRDDFVRLFGAGPEHALDFLDPEMFRRAHGTRG